MPEDDVERRAARGLSLVQMGDLSAGRQALEGADIAPMPLYRSCNTPGSDLLEPDWETKSRGLSWNTWHSLLSDTSGLLVEGRQRDHLG